MELVSVIIAALALVLSTVAFVDSRRRATSAASDAVRALAAAESSAEAATRSARAAERQVELAVPPAVAFRFESLNGNMYALRNVGAGVATGVTIDESVFVVNRNVPVNITLVPNEAADFFAMPASGFPLPSSVQVSCNELPVPATVPFVRKNR